MANSILITKGLSKSFSTEGVQRNVLRGLDLEIYEGDFTVIMGSSGSGKSTLLYSLSGIDKPSTGEITFCGTRIDGLDNDKLALFRRAHCGFVFQDILLNDGMSILDNVLVAGFLLKKDRKAVVSEAKAMLESVGIDTSMFNKFPAQMSGGELQRVALVRALINDPDVIFADEPTGALNSANSESVLDLFNRFNDAGKSVVMVTHDVKTASRGERILYLKDGVVLNELHLGKFREEDLKERLASLKDFLDEMGW